MIIVYPSDPSTVFLKEIVSSITKISCPDVNKVLPDEYEETITFINSIEKDRTILFLGHGYSEGLYGGCYIAEGRQILLDRKTADSIFRNRKIILLSCRSSELIASINETFNVAIGFGNIKAESKDLIGRKEKKKYRDNNCLKIFRESLVELFSNSIVECIANKYSYQQFYNSLKLRMNKYVCIFSMSCNKNERLAGELIYELKKEMIVVGNTMSSIA